MVGVAVLQPQDCMRDRHQTLINSHMKTRRNPNPARSNRRKRSPEKSSSNNKRENLPAKNLVMGEVKILKRGEELTVLKNIGSEGDEKKSKDRAGDLGDMVLSPSGVDVKKPEKKAGYFGHLVLTSTPSAVDEKKPKKKAGDLGDVLLSSTARLGPEPDMVAKQMRLGDFYAGSAFIASPPPSSLPLPPFFSKKSVLSENDTATTDIRRLLRLSLL